MTRLTGSCVVLVRTDHLLTPRRGFVVALRRSGLPFRRPPATGLLGHYPDRTFTGKPNAACQGTPAGFASCCGLVSCHRLHAVSSLRFDAGISPDAGSQLPGTLASPRAGLAPAGCPQLVARLRHVDLLVVITPKLLDALLYVPMPIAPIQP